MKSKSITIIEEYDIQPIYLNNGDTYNVCIGSKVQRCKVSKSTCIIGITNTKIYKNDSLISDIIKLSLCDGSTIESGMCL
jgi:hypothetical protein